MAGVEQIKVEDGEAGMRLDRWFKTHFPGLGFGHLQKLLRSGQVRVDGGRVKADSRIEPGQMIRIPPLGVDQRAPARSRRKPCATRTTATCWPDAALRGPKVFVFNKPAGLAVQGGSGVVRHVDDMLEAWRNQKGEKPRLVHRLDRDTSGVLVVARTRLAAMKLAEAFRARETKKTYWALVKGVPPKREDKISTWLVKEATPDGDRVRVAKHGEKGADHAVSYYRVHRAGGADALLAGDGALYRAHPPVARARRAYRLPDHRRPEIFRGRHQLGFSRRRPEQTASPRAAHRHPPSRQGLGRRDRADAAAYAPELELARLRRGKRGGRRRERRLQSWTGATRSTRAADSS